MLVPGMLKRQGDAVAGFTLLEVIAASMLAALIAGGTLMAFLSSSRMSSSSIHVEQASYLGQQTLDHYRNRIACDDAWFSSADCTAAGIPSPGEEDPLSPNSGVGNFADAKRCYVMTPRYFGPGGQIDPPDYYEMTVTVCWNGDAACACPDPN